MSSQIGARRWRLPASGYVSHLPILVASSIAAASKSCRASAKPISAPVDLSYLLVSHVKILRSFGMHEAVANRDGSIKRLKIRSAEIQLTVLTENSATTLAEKL